MASVAICVPWIDTGCEWRTRARDWTQGHWESLGVPVFYGTSDADPVNRSAARNDAMRKTDADIVVFADADTWVDGSSFAAMVDMADDTYDLVHGFTHLMHVSQLCTQQTLDGHTVLAGQTIEQQPSGVIACSRKLLDLVGGHDERFTGWGGEDRSFQLACYTLTGGGRRAPGLAYHLWHPRAPENGRLSRTRYANLALGVRYKEAAGTPATAGPLPRTKSTTPDRDAMLALMQEPGGPLAQVALPESAQAVD